MNSINASYNKLTPVSGPSYGPGILSHLVSSVRSLARLSLCWHLRSHSRRDLARLTDAQLDDIGISREAARKEANKAFWQN